MPSVEIPFCHPASHTRRAETQALQASGGNETSAPRLAVAYDFPVPVPLKLGNPPKQGLQWNMEGSLHMARGMFGICPDVQENWNCGPFQHFVHLRGTVLRNTTCKKKPAGVYEDDNAKQYIEEDLSRAHRCCSRMTVRSSLFQRVMPPAMVDALNPRARRSSAARELLFWVLQYTTIRWFR